jgi:DHA1 family bicyclomycin/chloramphenicol resistance-like MFS transporter
MCCTARTRSGLMAKVAILFAIAPAVSPIVGGYLLRFYDWRGIFIFLALFAGILLFAACLAWLPETLAVEKRQSLHPLKVIAGLSGHAESWAV